MKEEYELEKRVWSEKDFEIMGWHDCTIHALALVKHDLLLDLDYIFEWVEPSEPPPYRFWVAPGTLVFKNIHGLTIDITVEAWNVEGHQIDIDDIERGEQKEFREFDIVKEVEWKWNIYLHQGEIVFRSVGYKQYIREKPILVESMKLTPEERGGISFSTRMDG